MGVNIHYCIYFIYYVQWPKEDLKESQVPTKFVENAIMARLSMIDPYK